MAHGGARSGAGRKAGAVNEKTKKARESIALFVDENSERLSEWLDEIAKESPKQAFNCFMSVVEYHVPKLSREEHVGDKDKPIEHSLTVKFE